MILEAVHQYFQHAPNSNKSDGLGWFMQIKKKGLRSRKMSIIQPAKSQFHYPEQKQGYTYLTVNAAKCRKTSDHLLVQKALKPVSALSWEEVWKNSICQLCLQHFGIQPSLGECKLQTRLLELHFSVHVLNSHLPFWLHEHTNLHQTLIQEGVDILALGINANWTVWSSLLHFRCLQVGLGKEHYNPNPKTITPS